MHEAIFVGFRENTTTSQLFLSGRSMTWPVIGNNNDDLGFFRCKGVGYHGQGNY
jgi:hypothetical protein